MPDSVFVGLLGIVLFIGCVLAGSVELVLAAVELIFFLLYHLIIQLLIKYDMHNLYN